MSFEALEGEEGEEEEKEIDYIGVHHVMGTIFFYCVIANHIGGVILKYRKKILIFNFLYLYTMHEWAPVKFKGQFNIILLRNMHKYTAFIFWIASKILIILGQKAINEKY